MLKGDNGKKIFFTETISPAVLYYYNYLGFLHKLIQKNIMTPYWLNIEDIIAIAGDFVSVEEDTLKEKFSHFVNNRFLQQTKNNPIMLAEDILNNGYYVPMLSLINNKRFCNGTHRIGSLMSYHYNIEPIKKSFLCLSFNEDSFKEYNSNKTNGLSLPMIYDDKVTEVYPVSNMEIANLFDINGGMASNVSFDYNRYLDEEKLNFKKIIPAPCLNNRKLFDDYIQRPFSENYLSAINEHYGLFLPFQPQGSKSEKSFFLTEKDALELKRAK